MLLFTSNKKFSFCIIIIFLKIYIIKSATTDYEMERVCLSAEFNKTDHREGYRTIQHYVEDEDIKLTKAHPFYKVLFLEGKKKNLNIFINSISLELILEVLALIAFFNYFLFLCLWCGHCCLFKKLTDEEKLKKQSGCCKYCSFFIMLIYFLISSALSVFGILFISSYKKSFELSKCGLLRFTNHGLYGNDQSYAGAFNLKDTFINSSYSLNQIDIFYSKMFSNYNELISLNEEFQNRLNEGESLIEDEKIYSPNPDSRDSYFINTNYQPIFCPKTNESTVLGIIYKKYKNKIKPIIESLTKLKSYFERLSLNKNAFVPELKKIGEYFDIMKIMYESINRNIGKVYSDYTESGTKKI